MKFPKLPRMPELDALRGLFLVWMTLTHLPTHFSDLVNQPFRLRLLGGRLRFSLRAAGRPALYPSRRRRTEPACVPSSGGVRSNLRLSLIDADAAFTVAAGLAVTTHRTAIYNLLNFYIAHPFVAIVGSVLADLLSTAARHPADVCDLPRRHAAGLLSAAIRWGWNRILAASLAVWLLAQFGLRDLVHNAVVHITHLPIPLQETGAFNLFAWQWVWIAGMWLGAKSAEGPLPISRVPGRVTALCAAICVFFIGVRHDWFIRLGDLGARLTQQGLGMTLDKWSIGPLRMLNLVCFTIVLYWLRKPVLKIVAIEPFLTLGKASLEVFCAHVFFVFFGLALLYGEVTQLHGYLAIGLLVFTFTGLILVALREVRRRRNEKERAARDDQRNEATLPLPPTIRRIAG